MVNNQASVNSLAFFIAEDKKIDIEKAIKISSFLDKSKNLKAVIAPEIYCKHGKHRVYFELWSQNKMSAIDGLTKSYYDADMDSVIIVRHIFRTFLQDIRFLKFHCRSEFSGARTREAIKELAEEFS